MRQLEGVGGVSSSHMAAAAQSQSRGASLGVQFEVQEMTPPNWNFRSRTRGHGAGKR
jgi:hypothetical protein